MPHARADPRSHDLNLSARATARRPSLRANTLLVLVAAFLAAAANARFWTAVFATLPPSPWVAALDVAWTGLVLAVLAALVLLPLSVRGLFKPWLVVVLLLAAVAAHFTSRYAAFIDRHALASVFETDAREAGEWLSARMLLDVALLGLLPAALVCWVRIEWRSRLPESWSRLKLAAACIALVGGAVVFHGRELASLVRNHDELKHLASPYALVAATLSWLDHARNDDRPLQALGGDARRDPVQAASGRPVVLVVAIGESARAASMSLDGYRRDTDPELSRLPLVNFGNVSSCGTNTATSLPCMFSDLGRAGYDEAAAAHRENLLDVLAHAGYDVLWLDNNTGSKHLARRVREINVSAAREAAFCHDDGCWDGILVEHLRAELARVQRDTVFVVHLLGSHGPSYYQRYPPAFARFLPECRSNELQQCSGEEIVNAYDNSILYTDHVLADSVRVLQADASVDGMLLYISDHGESTGEHDLYLHGAPYVIAPSEQTRVPMLLWTSPGFEARRGLDLGCLRARADRPLSHDNLFHSLLGLASVSTAAYRRELDALSGCYLPAHATPASPAR